MLLTLVLLNQSEHVRATTRQYLDVYVENVHSKCRIICKCECTSVFYQSVLSLKVTSQYGGTSIGTATVWCIHSSYIQKAKKFADSVFQAKKICGKSA